MMYNDQMETKSVVFDGNYSTDQWTLDLHSSNSPLFTVVFVIITEIEPRGFNSEGSECGTIAIVDIIPCSCVHPLA